MKLIPYLKYEYVLNTDSIKETEELINKVIKPDQSNTEFVVLPNTKKKYAGFVSSSSKTFEIYRNWGFRSSSLISCYGRLDNTSGKTIVIATVRPDMITVVFPFLIFAYTFWQGKNIWGPFVIFFILYIFVFLIPVNMVGKDILDDLKAKLKPSKTTDLTPQALKL